MTVNSSNLEDHHSLPGNGNKKSIIKLSKRKNANKILRVKKMLKGMNLSSLGIKTPVYINYNLCNYYKVLWWKCKNFWWSKLIYAFWVYNGSIKLNIADNDRVYPINDRVYPDNDRVYPTVWKNYFLVMTFYWT